MFSLVSAIVRRSLPSVPICRDAPVCLIDEPMRLAGPLVIVPVMSSSSTISLLPSNCQVNVACWSAVVEPPLGLGGVTLKPIPEEKEGVGTPLMMMVEALKNMDGEET